MMSAFNAIFPANLLLRIRGVVLLLFFMLMISACGDNTTTSQSISGDTPFFDVKGYFEQQTAQLNSTQPEVKKRVSIGDEQEEKTITDIDFEKEFRVFQRSDINRPAWVDKYQVDSTLQEEELTSLQYTAKDTSLYTRLLRVSFRDGMVDSVRVFNRMRSAIASTEQRLLYCPGRNYRIESIQKTIGSDPEKVLIEVEFKK